MIRRLGLLLAVAAAALVLALHASAGGSPVRRARVQRPAAGVAMNFPQSVSFVSASTGWAWGPSAWPSGGPQAGLLARTDDGGRTWRQVGVPRAPWYAPEGGAGSVRFVDVRHGYLYGPQLWYTADGGRHWRQVAVRGSVSALARGFALVQADGRTYLDRLNGTRLARVVTVPAPGGVILVVRGTSVFVLAPRVSPDRLVPATLWASYNLGQSWTRFSAPCLWPGADPSAMAAWSRSGLALACGSPPGAGSQSKTFYASTDGGRSWTRRGQTTMFDHGYVGTLVALDARTWVLSEVRYPRLEITHDGGRRWSSPASTGFSGEWWGALSVFGRGEVVAAPGTLAGHELVLGTSHARRWSGVAVSLAPSRPALLPPLRRAAARLRWRLPAPAAGSRSSAVAR